MGDAMRAHCYMKSMILINLAIRAMDDARYYRLRTIRLRGQANRH